MLTLDELITLEIHLKTEIDIRVEEAVENITKAVKKVAWQAIPDGNKKTLKKTAQ
jgi:hypothetical protein